MAEEPIDWEHTMKDTQTAARAASRGGERMIKAMAEIKDEQTTLIEICRENRKEPAAIMETVKSLDREIAQATGRAAPTTLRFRTSKGT